MQDAQRTAGRAVSILARSACGVSPVPFLPLESRTLRNQPTLFFFVKKETNFAKTALKLN
ncbi:hypothetical protein NCCP133_38280 [Cytobacillus sp. NCCP-133]|nr:hypothetical protein NCCP133_38280 [Cytobacillus sp. NCCP-133]